MKSVSVAPGPRSRWFCWTAGRWNWMLRIWSSPTARSPLALAGIMGGLESGVSEQTRDIFIESAHFGPQVIRRGASSLSLKTDASFRFERGSDVGATVAALRLALGLIAEDQDSHISVSFFADQYPGRTESPPVRLPKDFPARFTGVAIPGATCKTILRRLGFQLQDRRDYWEVMVPSFRVDIVSKEDLVEEIIRVHGYEHLRSELPLSAAPTPAPSPERETLASVRAHLTSLGLSEAINYVFQSPEENELFYPGGASLTLKNPLGRDFSVLKNSLLPGLLHNIAFNLHQGLNGVLLFEIGKVFGPLHGDQEKNYLALALAGQFLKKDWRWPEVAADFHLLKSLLASLFQRLHLGLAFQALVKPGWHPECTFALVSQGRSLGVCGEVSGDCRRLYDNEVPVFAAELELAPLVSLRREERFRMWNRFPAAKRDFSFRIPAALAYDQLRACIEQVRPRELESYELFDVYQGGAGAISFSLSFTYRSPERTLTSEEVNGLHLRLTGELTRQLGLRPR